MRSLMFAILAMTFVTCLGCNSSHPAGDVPDGKRIATGKSVNHQQGVFEVYEVQTKDGTLYVVYGDGTVACTFAPRK